MILQGMLRSQGLGSQVMAPTQVLQSELSLLNVCAASLRSLLECNMRTSRTVIY